MIKARVAQRGKQLKTFATAQYALEAIGLSIGEGLALVLENPILYNGVDLSNSKVEVNTNAFELTDIQALKILAAYIESFLTDCESPRHETCRGLYVRFNYSFSQFMSYFSISHHY